MRPYLRSRRRTLIRSRKDDSSPPNLRLHNEVGYGRFLFVCVFMCATLFASLMNPMKGYLEFLDAEPKQSREYVTVSDLPEACRFTTHTNQRRDLPKRPPRLQTDSEGIPSEFISTRAIEPYEPMSLLVYNAKKRKVERPNIPLDDLPTNVTVICVPDGIIGDASIAGPYHDGAKTTISLYQSKRWFPPPDGFQDFVDRKPKVVDEVGMAVQVSAWTGFTWNHFPLDTLIRLGLVYDLLISDEPLWRDAKIVVSGSVTDEGDEMEEMVKFVYEKLGLTDRLYYNNGWIIKADSTPRFEYLVQPDVTPQPMCGPNEFVVDPVFPRGVLRPIQKALGSTESTPRKWIVYLGRQSAKRRAVEPKRKEQILKSIKKLLSKIDSSLEVVDWEFGEGKGPLQMLELLRHAAVVIGPHGANLWNAAFMPPGGLLVEFNTLKDEFTRRDCRAYGFSLANAGGQEFALVEAKGFGYENENLMPEVEHVVAIVEDFLSRAILNYER